MPTVFISYSWDSEAHCEWVKKLAEDLRAQGVHAWLDALDIKPGEDITLFMEQGVSKADFVFLICTDNYGAKANAKTGGVGYEQAIVTAGLLQSQTSAGRVVCILRSGTPSVAIPLYMKTRRWVDFRTEQEYGKALNQLLTHIFEYSDDQKSPIPTVLSEDLGKTAEPLVRPPVAPQQWILVAGTGITSKFTPELAELSRYLGNSLGTKGYGIITGGWPGVDETVARAFYAATKQLGSPLEDCLVQVVVNSKDPAFPAGQLVFVDRGDDEWSEPIRRADAIVLLGGVGGTWTTGKMALKMRRPVLPLADTGGDAKKLYIHMLKTWDEYAWMNISQTQFQTLANPGSDGVEAALILLSNIPKGGITA